MSDLHKYGLGDIVGTLTLCRKNLKALNEETKEAENTGWKKEGKISAFFSEGGEEIFKQKMVPNLEHRG